MTNNILPLARQFVALPLVLLIGCVDDLPTSPELGSQWLTFTNNSSGCDAPSDTSMGMAR